MVAAYALPFAPDHASAFADDLRRRAARRGLAAFTRRMFPDYTAARHITELVAALEWAAGTEGARLIVTLPPRHSKSLHVSEHLPAWYLGRSPDKRVIAASHSASLAHTFSRRVRNKMSDPRWPFPEVAIAGDKAAVSAWDIAGGMGGYAAVGALGSPVGLGCDLMIVDDPLRSAADADSQTTRDALWEWWQGTMRTRLEPGGSIILTATRWHEDDLTGRLLAAEREGGEHWRHLYLPALNDAGEALWPERWPVQALERIKTAVGSRVWEAQYQGRPSPAAGGILQRGWWRFYRDIPSDLIRHTQSWDMSFRETKAGSYVVGQVWACRGADRYLLDQVRARMDFPATLQAVRALSAKWPQAAAKLVEDKANGPAIVAQLKHEVSGLIEVTPAGGKEARASAVAPQIEAKNVYLPDPSIAPWVHDFIEECAAFPNGANDDCVDAMSQALNRLAHKKEIGAIDLSGLGRANPLAGIGLTP